MRKPKKLQEFYEYPFVGISLYICLGILAKYIINLLYIICDIISIKLIFGINNNDGTNNYINYFI